MSVGLWPMFDPTDTGIQPRLEGKVLFGNLPALDTIAGRLGVRALSSFMDNRPEPEGFSFDAMPDPHTDPERLAEWLENAEGAFAEREVREPWSDWFTPADGLATVTALARTLERRDNLPTLEGSVDDVLAEVQELGRCLALAHTADIRFRLDAF